MKAPASVEMLCLLSWFFRSAAPQLPYAAARILSQAAPEVGKLINSVDDIHMPPFVDVVGPEEIVAVG
jgi:hypothetical protein